MIDFVRFGEQRIRLESILSYTAAEKGAGKNKKFQLVVNIPSENGSTGVTKLVEEFDNIEDRDEWLACLDDVLVINAVIDDDDMDDYGESDVPDISDEVDVEDEEDYEDEEDEEDDD